MRLRIQYFALVVLMPTAFHVCAAVLYVDLNNPSPIPLYTNWLTAATNIQDAIDAASPGDQVLVTNGVYQSGQRLGGGDSTANRVAITQVMTVQSVNGPAATMIEGHQVPGTTNGLGAVRCVYLINGAALIGFTLTNGATASIGSGGGVSFQTLFHTTSFMSNCVIAGNSADVSGGGVAGGGNVINCVISHNWARQEAGGAGGAVLVGCIVSGNSAGILGGGSVQGVLTNCVLASNSAGTSGGASYGDKLYNCTITGNSVTGTNLLYSGGGVANASIVANCVVYSNTAPQQPNYYDSSPMVYSCTTPLSPGAGNITNPPLFVAPANGDYHLQANSPCINAGNNAYAHNNLDVDGNSRVVGGSVDMGAYEFQNPTSTISYAWLQWYGLPTDGSADSTDPDGDGMNNWQEWRCGTDPTNTLSVLKMLAPSNSVSGVSVRWESVPGISYFLQRSTSASAPVGFLTIKSSIAGQVGTTGYLDTNANTGSPYFYRVGLQP